MPVIYKITSPSNKVYIGQSWNWVKRRSNYKHLRCKLQHALYNSFVKYGYDAHVKSILLVLPEDISQEELNSWEIFYWKKYRDSGYEMLNLKEPGSNGKFPESIKTKMRESAKNVIHKSHSKETCEKITQSKLGKKRKPFTAEARLNMSLAQRGKVRSPEAKIKYSMGKKGIPSPFKNVKQSEEWIQKRMEGKRKKKEALLSQNLLQKI